MRISSGWPMISAPPGHTVAPRVRALRQDRVGDQLAQPLRPDKTAWLDALAASRDWTESESGGWSLRVQLPVLTDPSRKLMPAPYEASCPLNQRLLAS